MWDCNISDNRYKKIIFCAQFFLVNVNSRELIQLVSDYLPRTVVRKLPTFLLVVLYLLTIFSTLLNSSRYSYPLKIYRVKFVFFENNRYSCPSLVALLAITSLGLLRNSRSQVYHSDVRSVHHVVFLCSSRLRHFRYRDVPLGQIAIMTDNTRIRSYRSLDLSSILKDYRKSMLILANYLPSAGNPALGRNQCAVVEEELLSNAKSMREWLHRIACFILLEFYE